MTEIKSTFSLDFLCKCVHSAGGVIWKEKLSGAITWRTAVSK